MLKQERVRNIHFALTIRPYIWKTSVIQDMHSSDINTCYLSKGILWPYTDILQEDQ
jgi:hypothetical protein